MTRSRRLLLLIATLAAGVVGIAGTAQATLVPGELRFGATSSDPAVPLFDPANPLATSLALRELPGGAPTITFPNGGGTVLTCAPLPADAVHSTLGLTSNGPVAGQELYIRSDNCQSPFVSGRIELRVFGDPLGSFAMRAEANSGRRDGILEPQPGKPFRVTANFFNPGQTEPYDGCIWSIYSPGQPTRIDMYNPGHGHKIDFESEPLRYVSGFNLCNVANFELHAELRLRGYDASSTGPIPWTKPVWILPTAASPTAAG
jgi:hypothetical protein